MSRVIFTISYEILPDEEAIICRFREDEGIFSRRWGG